MRCTLHSAAVLHHIGITSQSQHSYPQGQSFWSPNVVFDTFSTGIGKPQSVTPKFPPPDLIRALPAYQD